MPLLGLGGCGCSGGSRAPASFADYGLYEAQGRRKNMEDATLACARLPRVCEPAEGGGEVLSAAFGVFDGHGSTFFSAYLKEAMARHLGAADLSDPRTAVSDVFLTLDAEMAEAAQQIEDEHSREHVLRSGSTANLVLLRCEADARGEYSTRLLCANLGDTRCTVACNGKAIDLSNDHKASNEDEEARIFAAGGCVAENRVMGVLAVARAFGDLHFKKPLGDKFWAEDLPPSGLEADLVSNVPEITERELTADDEFCIIGCDGVWDVCSSQEAVDLVVQVTTAGGSYQKAARAIVELALQRHTNDNVSVVVFALNPVVGMGAGRCTVS